MSSSNFPVVVYNYTKTEKLKLNYTHLQMNTIFPLFNFYMEYSEY